MNSESQSAQETGFRSWKRLTERDRIGNVQSVCERSRHFIDLVANPNRRITIIAEDLWFGSRVNLSLTSKYTPFKKSY